MIDIKQINEKYHLGREQVGGKVYVMTSNEGHIASYSGFTETLEWYQTVNPEDMTIIETYLKENH